MSTSNPRTRNLIAPCGHSDFGYRVIGYIAKTGVYSARDKPSSHRGRGIITLRVTVSLKGFWNCGNADTGPAELICTQPGLAKRPALLRYAKDGTGSGGYVMVRLVVA